jgi:hypothetical protein
VKTSGTTAGDKLIPVTPKAFASHRRGGWDALVMAVERVGAPTLPGGPMLFLGGLHATIHRVPRSAPSRSWEARIGAIARFVARQNIRLLSGMPSWTLI